MVPPAELIKAATIVPRNLAIFGLFCIIFYRIATAFYNVFFHPLAKFPGPRLRAATHLPAWWTMWTGDVHCMTTLHERYGPVVRIAPDSLSFITAQAWKDIYGHVQGRSQIPKDAAFYSRGRVKGSGPSIMNALHADHSRMRRLLSYAFSQQALNEQESLITKYFDLLTTKLKEQAVLPNNISINIAKYFDFVTFDITGDMAFGQPFGALTQGKYHFFMENIFMFMKSGRILVTGSTFGPPVGWMIDLMMQRLPVIVKNRLKHRAFVLDRTETRLNTQTDRKDFMSYLTKHNDEKGMSRTELSDTCNVLIVAGSETTATVLSGTTYLLLSNPAVLATLVAEIRAAFSSPSEINFLSARKLPYLMACLEEGMRCFPPIPGLNPRRTVEPVVVDGHAIPIGTYLGVHQWAAYHSPLNFKHPELFAPERWLPGHGLTDQKDVLQPFSIGPRNCIGKSLAYAEMTCILSRVLLDFDMELSEDSSKWAEGQRAWVIWAKPPLNVKLSLRSEKV